MAALVLLVAWIPLYYSGVSAGYALLHPYQGAKFNRTAWDLGGGERNPMTQDIIDHRVTRGMTGPQVAALLGPPTRTDTDPLFNTREWSYELGPTWDGMDSHHLTVVFAPDGTVLRLSAFPGFHL